jgi:phage terminase large subunit
MSKYSLTLDRPSEKQIRFLEAKTKHVGFGGARGGGKSWAVRDKAKRLCLRYGGIKILIVRRSFPELLNNHILPLQSTIPSAVASYNKSEKLFRFLNGSIIKFGYCKCDGDL